MYMIRAIVIAGLLAVYAVLPAVSVSAQTVESSPARVLITELQTESELSANEEFIEITNIWDEPVPINGWAIQYRSATGTAWQDKALLSGTLYSNSSIVISTQGYNVDQSTFFWNSSSGQLAASGGNIRIIGTDTIVAEDTLAWGTGIYGEGLAATRATKGKSLHRKTVDSKFIDTNSNFDDFIEDLTDPVNNNQPPEVEEELDPSPDPAVDEPVIDTPEETSTDPEVLPDPSPEEVEPDPEIPPVDEAEPEAAIPLLPLVINELMINPLSPLLDSQDEWIELYNPNETSLSLASYKLQSGSSFSYSHIFADEQIDAYGYLIVPSSTSGLALSNTAGAVRLLDAVGSVVGGVVSYDDVEEGSSYARDETGQWRWTITPTSAQQNIFTEAPIVIKASVATSPKKASTAKTSTTKTTATKASATKVPKATAVKAASTAKPSTFAADGAEQPQKSRPLLLASFAVVAVLYGLYEYREDISNSLWRARRYLESRRKNRSVM
jgi:hypothetical protein